MFFEILTTGVTVIFIIISLLMVLIILLQAGRGGMGTALGGGASQTVFGGSGGDILSKLTQSLAAGFMICAIFLAYTSSHTESRTLRDRSEELDLQENLVGADEEINYEQIGYNPLDLPKPGAAVRSSSPAPEAEKSESVDTPVESPASDSDLSND